MSASNSSGGRIAAENELLAQLGLPPSASPEDVDQLHLAVSQFLSAAPTSVKGWARAQAAALDEAYLQLTDPVGLEGSALRSPARPPTVVPGGPATPPARRGPVPALGAAAVAADVEPLTDEAPAAADDAPATDDTDTDDIDALFASVTPGAHRDLTSGGKADKVATPARPALPPAVATPKTKAVYRSTGGARVQVATPAVAPAPSSSGPWRGVAIFATGALVVALLAFVIVPFVFNLGSGGGTASVSASPAASAGIDMAQVASLMQKISANPSDTASLQSLGDLYYGAGDYANAGTFYDKLLALDPKNIKGLLARGAVYYNTSDMVNAKTSWLAVVDVDPKNVEAHYDLGFLAMNQTPADWATVQTEWRLVIALDPGSDVANTVQQHLDALVKASMIPAPSGAPATSGSPAASGAAPSGSATPSGAASSASPASTTLNEGALNQAFTAGTLNAPASTPFTIHFNNQDSGVPSDMLIKDSAGNTVFKGDMVTGPAAVDYAVPALAAGTYTFTCTIHPTTMNGTLVVGS